MIIKYNKILIFIIGITILFILKHYIYYSHIYIFPSINTNINLKFTLKIQIILLIIIYCKY